MRKRTQLPKELIDDFKNNVKIRDLSRKYELSPQVIRNQLINMKLEEKTTWGGTGRGGGRKKKPQNNELERIRERNAKMSFAKQPEGTKANPRFNGCRKYNNDFYLGGF